MSKQSDRKRLIKLIGKVVTYYGTFVKRSEKYDSILLRNIKHNGKEVTDHIWISNTIELDNSKYGEEYSFLATANTYRDSKQRRKYGLNNAHKFNRSLDILIEVGKDSEQKRKRKR